MLFTNCDLDIWHFLLRRITIVLEKEDNETFGFEVQVLLTQESLGGGVKFFEGALVILTAIKRNDYVDAKCRIEEIGHFFPRKRL